MIHSMMQNLVQLFGSIDYTAIFLLMTLESSIVPVPSELVMIPAGIIASSGWLNPWIATIVGWIGSVVGALLNYYILGRILGRVFIEKYGKYILITDDKYKKAEDLFTRNDRLYTFIARLIPVVRHIISIPAGIFRMPIVPFILITFLGATLWCGILVTLWYYSGPYMITAIGRYGNEIGYASTILIWVYLWYKIYYRK